MRKFAGLDVSLRTTSVCIVDDTGVILDEAVVETEPKALIAYLKAHGRLNRVGLEAGSRSTWLAERLQAARLAVICIEVAHAHGVLKATRNKTDRNDARGISEIMRTGIYRAVHQKSKYSQHIRALLTARKLLLVKAMDVESSIVGVLREFGLKAKRPSMPDFEGNVRALLSEAKHLVSIVEPLLVARASLRSEFRRLDQEVVATANDDVVCVRLMTAPGVGPITALTYRQVIDDPMRFPKSRIVAAHIGLTPRVRQSGVSEIRGGITKSGDVTLRSAMVNAALTYLSPRTKPSDLGAWGAQVAARRGRKKALIAIARRLTTILHRMWIDGTDFRRQAHTA